MGIKRELYKYVEYQEYMRLYNELNYLIIEINSRYKALFQEQTGILSTGYIVEDTCADIRRKKDEQLAEFITQHMDKPIEGELREMLIQLCAVPNGRGGFNKTPSKLNPMLESFGVEIKPRPKDSKWFLRTK